MISFRTLGALSLRGPDGHEVQSVLAQPKRAALLAYLALAGADGMHRRDALLGVFWPESDQDRARSALRQALHYLRGSLGSGLIASRGDEEVGIAPGRLWCDAAAFREAARLRRDGEAMELYRGDLLDALPLPDAPEFEAWLTRERECLRRAAAQSAARLADGARGEGRVDDALRWARRAVELAPGDGGAALALVSLLDAQGDPAAALRAYAGHAALLHGELGIQPAAALRDLASGIRAREDVPAAPPSIAPVVVQPRESVEQMRPAPPVNVDDSAHSAAKASASATVELPESLVEIAAESSDKRVDRNARLTISPSVEEHREGRAAEGTAEARMTGTRRWSRRRVPGVARKWAVPLVLGTALALAAWALRPAQASAPGSQAEAIVVMPFRVTGADPSLAYLREGMVDLIAAKLTGGGVPRAVDPRTVVARLRRASPEGGDPSQADALELARGLGARSVLLGGIVGTPAHVVLTATIAGAGPAAPHATASVEGPADAFPVLVDRLVAQLVSREAGEGEDRMFALTGTPLEALKAYLAGQAAYRRGRMEEALAHYARALAVDSTFALAGLGLASTAVASSGLYTGPDVHAGAIARAWALRDGLSARDRAYLSGIAGPHYPARSTRAEHLAAWERAVQQAPDRPEAWYELGDLYYHAGRLLGVPDAPLRAEAALRRALELDPGFAVPEQHLVELAAARGDTARARIRLAAYLRDNPTAEMAPYVRWRVAAARRDRAGADSLWRAPADVPTGSLLRVLATGQYEPALLPHAERAAAVLSTRYGPPSEVWRILYDLEMYEQNRGHAARALALTRRLAEVQPDAHMYLRKQVLDALYSTGSAAAALQALPTLAAGMGQEARLGAGVAHRDACTAVQWRLWHGDTTGAAGAIRQLQGAVASRGTDPLPAENESCAQLLRTLLSAAQQRPDAPAQLARLAERMMAGPMPSPGGCYTSLAVARLYERQGDAAAALQAVRRRWDSPEYLSAYLHDEARLAERAGDVGGAVRAYRRYLALRATPDPSVAPEVARARESLRRLLAAERTRLPAWEGGVSRSEAR